MCSFPSLRQFTIEQLSAAAVEMFPVFEQALSQYQETINAQRRVLSITRKTQTKTRNTENPRQHSWEERHLCNKNENSCLGRAEPEPLQFITEEPQPPQIIGEVLKPPQINMEEPKPETPQIIVEVLKPPQINMEEPEPPQIKEEQKEPELPWIKVEEPEYPRAIEDQMPQEDDTVVLPIIDENSIHTEDLESHNSVREFIGRRLTTAAVEIFTMYLQTLAQYQQEIDAQRRLLNITLKPQIKLHRIDDPEQHDCKEELLSNQMTTSTANTTSTDESHPSPQSDTEEDDSPGPSNTLKKILTEAPELTPTKSIIMKYTDLQDPGDDSSSENADEYFPDNISKNDSDATPDLNQSAKPLTPNQKMDISGSMSPIDSTNSDRITSDRDKHSLTSEGTEAQEEPCSSRNLSDIVVNAYKSKDGKRVYDKKNYCWYCNKPYSKMARHLELAHEDKSDVAKALCFPKGSKERKTQLGYIRNKGNYVHNASVTESGKGELVPFKRPSKKSKGVDFMYCPYCQALCKRKTLWRHMSICKIRPGSVTLKPGKNSIQSMCTSTMPVPSNQTQTLWGLISAMNPDPITNIVKNDQVIIDIGQHLLNKGGTSAKNQLCVRGKMQELGRLVHNARRFTNLKHMKDFINPKKYMQTVKAVKITCGYNGETNKFLVPSLAKKLGKILVEVSKLLKAQGFISNNEELVKNATDFQAVHQEKWNEMILATALRNIRDGKCNMPTLLDFTEDVQKLHTYLSQMFDTWYKSISESPTSKAWKKLARVCLAQIILFNRRREGGVAKMPLATFSSHDTCDQPDDVDWALSEVEKKLCRHFTRIVTRRKHGRPVPTLLTPKMLSALDLLVQQREACGVSKDNRYLFARPRATSHFQGSECLRSFAKACGAKCPKSLTSPRLRKQAASLSTVLNMTEAEMEQLATFLGLDRRIQGEFYQLPETSLQLARIGKVLMALEQGRLAEFHGKDLDEIEINPDENVLDWDEEERCASESNVVPPPPKRCKLQSSNDKKTSGFSSSTKGKSTPAKKRPR